MKKIFWGALAILTGEFLVLKKKDKEFNDQLREKEGIDKIKYVFDKLFNFNKDLFGEAKQSVEDIDFKEKRQKGKDRAKDQTKEKVKQAADKVKETADKVKKKVDKSD